jgi:hypothetical protein
MEREFQSKLMKEETLHFHDIFKFHVDSTTCFSKKYSNYRKEISRHSKEPQNL